MSALRPPEMLETVRLRLRPAAVADAPFVFNGYGSDPDVARYMMWPRQSRIEDAVGFLQRCEAVWQAGTSFPWLVERRQDGEPLGMIEMRIDGFKANIGYVFARSYWGNGYATEAATALRDWALAQPAIYRFWAYCDTDNAASARVMEKVGMKKEGVLRRWVIHPNVSAAPRDALCYAIVKEAGAL
ncbi:MAG: GNAT family N-acetyltransferase [Rhodothermales bacterium]